MDNLLIVLGGMAIFGAWSAFASFILLFHVLADWRSSEMGRHIMSFMAVFAVILTYILVVFLVADGHPGGARGWIRLATYGSVAVVGWWRVRILIRTQRESRARQSVTETLEGVK